MQEKLSEVHLDQLEDIYQGYRDVIDPIDPSESVQIPYRQEVIEDNLEKARKALPVDCDQATYDAAIEKAQTATYSARQHALTESGFVGSIVGLLQEVVKAESSDEIKAVNERLRLYSQIPAAHIKGAGLVTELGYYWGGKYIAF